MLVGAAFEDSSLICGRHGLLLCFLPYLLHPCRPSCLTHLHRRLLHNVLFHKTTTRNEPSSTGTLVILRGRRAGITNFPSVGINSSASHIMMSTFSFVSSPVTDLRLSARFFDKVKCDILTKDQEADSALKLEEISRTFPSLCESLVLVCPFGHE